MTEAAEGRRPLWRRLVPLALLAAAIALAFALGLDDYLSFEALRANRERLLELVQRYGVVAGIGYMAVYAGVVALSLPGATFMTLAGGFMFGAALATLYTVIGATAGATVIFLIARTAAGDVLARRAGPALRRMEQGFRDNALNYLLVLRLIPLFPFWLVNLVPALLEVPLRTYVIGTFFGIIPGTFVYCLAGAGLGSVLESGAEFSLAGVLTPTMIAALAGLALLALLPIAYKRLRGGR
ncbi:MAG TPA: TVP38/TMEM64 family protein [Alphaproteobacteria bacterium]